MTRSRQRGGDLAPIASAIQRLAVLLAAGVPPGAAWGYLAEGPIPVAVANADRAGSNIPDAIVAESEGVPTAERQAWRTLATAWSVAIEAGAPLAPTLREVASSLRDLAQVQRDIAVALAAPTATARLVVVLPLVGVVFGVALGFNTLVVLLTTVPGWMCLVLGAGLVLAASRWNRRLVRRAQPRDLAPGLAFDLMAIAVSGGAPIDRARMVVASAVERCSLVAIDDTGVNEVVELSQRAGVPAAELLRSEGVERRRVSLSEARLRAEALGVRLMIPLGVCVLPAFMVLCVAPLLLAVLAQTRTGT
jgi:tight adherence protein B